MWVLGEVFWQMFHAVKCSPLCHQGTLEWAIVNGLQYFLQILLIWDFLTLTGFLEMHSEFLEYLAVKLTEKVQRCYEVLIFIRRLIHDKKMSTVDYYWGQVKEKRKKEGAMFWISCIQIENSILYHYFFYSRPLWGRSWIWRGISKATFLKPEVVAEIGQGEGLKRRRDKKGSRFRHIHVVKFGLDIW